MSKLGDQPAFPVQDAATWQAHGMTMRQHYAGLAMQGLLADHKDHEDELRPGETCAQAVARLAVEHADALLASLAVDKTGTAPK